eukprot:c28987_g1_i1 orf=192-3179(+)
MFIELIPISTLLTLLTTQILETAVAAHDVLVEKETFRLLTTFFMDIQPVLSKLASRNMGDSPAARQALESLQGDVKKARNLVDLCKKKSRIYSLLHCRTIVKEAEQISRNVAKSLALLSLASTEVALDIRDNVDKLREQMLNAKFQASEQKLRIVEKIETDLRQRRSDQDAMNDLIRDIAGAVGLPSEDAEMKKVLHSLQVEIEDASANKEKEELFYMEQILALLSGPTSAPETFCLGSRNRNFEEEEPPLKSFICPLSNEVMKDPVMIATGYTFERSYIQRRFDSGETTDPVTKSLLSSLTLRPNIQIQKTIEEWVEHNNRVRVRKAGKRLEADDVIIIKEALEDLSHLCNEIPKARHWIEEDKLTAQIVLLLKHENKEVKRKSLSALQIIVTGNEKSKEQLVNAGGVQNIVRCLGRESLSKLALGLLLQLLQAGTQDMPRRNYSVYNKLTQTKGSILLLVMSLHGKDAEAACLAKEILEQICDEDQNIIEMAKANWFTPLIRGLSHGSDESRLRMASALADMELTELNKQNVGEGGAIAPLVGLISEKLEMKAVALKVLESLSDITNNKSYMAEAGAVPIVFQTLFSARNPLNIRESAAVILEKLVVGDGRRYLKDANGSAIDLSKTVQDLLVLQENSSKLLSIRKHVLIFLLRLVTPPDAQEVRTMLKDARGVSTLLPLLVESSDSEIRDVVVELLFCLSNDCAQEISLFLIQRKLGGLFASLLQDSARRDVQVAAAGILANLPPENSGLTMYLMEEGVLTALVNVLRDGNVKVKENAVGSLLRFTLPSNIYLQQRLVELGIFPILKTLMKSGTALSKQRALTMLGNLSKSTLHLCKPPSSSGCFYVLKKPPSICRVHPGPCRERTTFCLVVSKMISDIVCVMSEPENDAAGAAVDALFTLIYEDDILDKGASLLHEEEAITAIVKLLSQGTDNSKERAIFILERIFKVKRMKDFYGSHARIPLAELAVNGNSVVQKQALKVLAQLEAIHEA